jgi:hypothetical protein
MILYYMILILAFIYIYNNIENDDCEIILSEV